MIINVLDQTQTYANEIGSIEACLAMVEQILKENDVYIDYMDVDGIEVYQEFAEYLLEHIQNVKVIEVKVHTLRQLMDESMITMQSYLAGALPEVKRLADEFYQGATKESWSKLNQLLEGLLWISQTVDSVVTKPIYSDKSVYVECSSMLRDELSNLEVALTDSDMVLTGDILKYEVTTILDNLLNAVTQTIDNEVVRNDLN